MFNILKAKLGLGNQEQAVNSIELAENEVQLWDEMDDETAAVYGGGRRRSRNIKVDYETQLRVLKGLRLRQVAKRRARKGELALRNLPPGVYSVRYRALKRGPKLPSRGTTKTNTASKNSFSSANSFNF